MLLLSEVLSFLALKRLKTKTKYETRNNWLGHLTILHVYQEEINKIDIHKITNKFAAKNDSRKERFSLLQVLQY